MELFGLQIWMHVAIIGGSFTIGLLITCLIDWIHQKYKQKTCKDR